jgi:hypothetical protein
MTHKTRTHKPFMTSEALGLNSLQYESLIASLDVLESGAIKYIEVGGRGSNADVKTAPKPYNFNMDSWRVKKKDCGTVCCIGGLSEILAQKRLYGNGMPYALENLFYPSTLMWCSYSDITIKQASTALRNYLTTGKANWERVLRNVVGKNVLNYRRSVA